MSVPPSVAKPVQAARLFAILGDPTRLLLLVKDKVGYLNLCELLSKAWLTNQYRGRAELDASWLDGELSRGLLALSGAQQGDIGLALAAGNEDAARRHAERWAKVFPASTSSCNVTASRAPRPTSSRPRRSPRR